MLYKLTSNLRKALVMTFNATYFRDEIFVFLIAEFAHALNEPSVKT